MPTAELKWFEEACRVINHPIAFVDVDQRYVWVNHAYSQLLGYSPSELRGVTWMSVTAPQDVGGDLHSIEDVLAGESVNYTLLKRYVRKNGTMLPVAITVWRYPADCDQAIQGFTIQATSEVLTDITEIKRQHENELATLRERMDRVEWRHDSFAKLGSGVRKWAPIMSLAGGAIAWFISAVVDLVRAKPD